MSYRVSVDTGGTFSDLVLYNQETGVVRVWKLPSTPKDPSQAIITGIYEVMGHDVKPEQVVFFSHGTTVGTNALLEGKGAKVGLLVTQGFTGIYEVREQRRGYGSAIYDLAYERPAPLVQPDMTMEIPERVGADGTVIQAVDETAARQAISKLKEAGVESTAACFLFSFLRPEHELIIRRICEEVWPEQPVSLSCEVLPQIREYYRMSTTLVNAYIAPIVSRYLERLDKSLWESGIRSRQPYVMQSNGGVASFAEAGRLAVTTALSGPAAGVIASIWLAGSVGVGDIVTFDMGGTSCDVSLVNRGQATITTQATVAGYDVNTPMIDINTVSAGGGTIAWVDEVGSLRVGPHSAGADPGPVAYGRGGKEPAVTDANLILGYLNPHSFLGGRLALDRAAAAKAVENKLCSLLGLTVTEAAFGTVRLINVVMEEAIKDISSRRGYDLSQFYLLAFGGAGPVHAGRVALDLGMKGVLIPPHPGVTSALGLLLADVRHDFMRSRLIAWENVKPEDVISLLKEMQQQGQDVLSKEGFAPEDSQFEAGLDLRYRGQGYEVTVPLTGWQGQNLDLPRIRQDFDDIHERLFGHRAEDAEVDLVQLRFTAIGKVTKPTVQSLPVKGYSLSDAVTGMREAYFPESGWTEIPIYRRDHLDPGHQLTGPAVIEQFDSTVVVDPGLLATVDSQGNVILTNGNRKVDGRREGTR